MIGIPRVRAMLLAAVVGALAAIVGAAWLHEIRPPSVRQSFDAPFAVRQAPALTADEERFAATLWDVHREATRSAVAMSFAGITYETEGRDARALAAKIAPLAKLFQDAETLVGTMSAPASLAQTHGQYVEAMRLYAKAANEMLKFTEDGDTQHLATAHLMDVSASEDMLRVGEVLWPGQYKPH
jgi:hypothetical protein